jgi:hypothetical protein
MFSPLFQFVRQHAQPSLMFLARGALLPDIRSARLRAHDRLIRVGQFA